MNRLKESEKKLKGEAIIKTDTFRKEKNSKNKIYKSPKLIPKEKGEFIDQKRSNKRK